MFTYSLVALAPRLLAPYPPAMPRCRPLVLALAALTCGDDPSEPAALAELCGRADPTRLLALPPGRRLGVDTVPLRVGDRHVFLTAVVDPNASGDLETDREQLTEQQAIERDLHAVIGAIAAARLAFDEP